MPLRNTHTKVTKTKTKNGGVKRKVVRVKASVTKPRKRK